jgi:hypothetical protein
MDKTQIEQAREAIKRAELAVTDSIELWTTTRPTIAASEAVVMIIEAAKFEDVRSEMKALYRLCDVTDGEGKRNPYFFDFIHIIEYVQRSFPTMENSQVNVLGWILREGCAWHRNLEFVPETSFRYLLDLCYAHSNASYFIASALISFDFMLAFSVEIRVFASYELLSLVKFLIKGHTVRSSPLWMMDAVHLCEGLFCYQEARDRVRVFFLEDGEFARNFVDLLRVPGRGRFCIGDLPTFEIPLSPHPHTFCLIAAYDLIFQQIPGMIDIAEECWGFSPKKSDGSLMSYRECAKVFYEDTLPKSAA